MKNSEQLSQRAGLKDKEVRCRKCTIEVIDGFGQLRETRPRMKFSGFSLFGDAHYVCPKCGTTCVISAGELPGEVRGDQYYQKTKPRRRLASD